MYFYLKKKIVLEPHEYNEAHENLLLMLHSMSCEQVAREDQNHLFHKNNDISTSSTGLMECNL